LEDARGRLHLLAQDQHGSRFIQQQLETDDVAVKNAAFDELLPHFPMLITNVFGNYVVQKFLDHGTPEHKCVRPVASSFWSRCLIVAFPRGSRAHIADMLIKDMLELTLQMYGCRVVQKGLDVLPRDIIAHMIRRLDGHVVECVEDQNGNHVVQKCIEVIFFPLVPLLPPDNVTLCVQIAADGVDFIVGSFRGHVRHLSAHPYGCRVIQRVLEHCSVDKARGSGVAVVVCVCV
jgi:pumilio RNA-binding family